jgi:Glucose-6-phosphate dehydrogenase, NAD binding domain
MGSKRYEESGNIHGRATLTDALVIFGATGDLTYKIIFPALYAMVTRGVLNVPVMGVTAEVATGFGGSNLGLDTFGLSAPMKVVAQQFGLQPAHVAVAAREHAVRYASKA